jgi:hypothetical protein
MARKKGVPNVRNQGSRSRGEEKSPPRVELQPAPAQLPPQQLAPPQPVHTYYATPALPPPQPAAPVYQQAIPRPVALPGESVAAPQRAVRPSSSLCVRSARVTELNGRGPRLPPGLDLFAEIYQPLWLRNVNDGPFAHYFQRSPAEATWVRRDPLLDFDSKLTLHCRLYTKRTSTRYSPSPSVASSPCSRTIIANRSSRSSSPSSHRRPSSNSRHRPPLASSPNVPAHHPTAPSPLLGPRTCRRSVNPFPSLSNDNFALSSPVSHHQHTPSSGSRCRRSNTPLSTSSSGTRGYSRLPSLGFLLFLPRPLRQRLRSSTYYKLLQSGKDGQLSTFATCSRFGS